MLIVKILLLYCYIASKDTSEGRDCEYVCLALTFVQILVRAPHDLLHLCVPKTKVWYCLNSCWFCRDGLMFYGNGDHVLRRWGDWNHYIRWFTDFWFCLLHLVFWMYNKLFERLRSFKKGEGSFFSISMAVKIILAPASKTTIGCSACIEEEYGLLVKTGNYQDTNMCNSWPCHIISIWPWSRYVR